MNSSGNVISRAFSAFVGGMNSIGTVLIFGLVVMINLDVFSRFLFNAPIDGVKELVELSIVAIVFLQLPDAVRAGRLTRSDGLYSRFAGKVIRVLLTGSVLFSTLPAHCSSWRSLWGRYRAW